MNTKIIIVHELFTHLLLFTSSQETQLNEIELPKMLSYAS